MKKFLLLSAAALMAGSAMAATDGATYEQKGGLTLENLWIFSTNSNIEEFQQYAFLNAAKCRTATLYDGIVYVGNSTNDDPSIVDETGAAVDCCSIEKFDAATGAYLGKLQVTYNGERVSGLLCANSIGVDSFGNLYVAACDTSVDGSYILYVVDKETGEAQQISCPVYMTSGVRIDYCDVIGDLTLQQSGAVIMAAVASSDLSIFRWTAQQGQTLADYTGGWNEMGDEMLPMSAADPADQTEWGTAPIVRIVLGEGDAAYNGDLFYVDGFTTFPTLYDTTGSIVDSFANTVTETGDVDEEGNPITTSCYPENAGTNGVNEIQIGSHNLIVYSNNQHTGSNGGNELWIAEMGEGMAFAGMQQLWMVPAMGLGMTSDTGTRVHCIAKEYTEYNGHEAVNILTFKTMNGMGVYRLVDTETDGVAANIADVAAAKIYVNGGLIKVSAPASSIEVYNVAGQLVDRVANADEIAAPADGVYVVKAMVGGNAVVQKVIL